MNTEGDLFKFRADRLGGGDKHKNVLWCVYAWFLCLINVILRFFQDTGRHYHASKNDDTLSRMIVNDGRRITIEKLLLFVCDWFK